MDESREATRDALERVAARCAVNQAATLKFVERHLRVPLGRHGRPEDGLVYLRGCVDQHEGERAAAGDGARGAPAATVPAAADGARGGGSACCALCGAQ